MRDQKINEVLRYLRVHFPSRGVERKYDFDRDAESFKVMLDRGTLLLKVTETFLDDNDVLLIVDLLDRAQAAEALERTAGTGRGLIVTVNGLKEFDRG